MFVQVKSLSSVVIAALVAAIHEHRPDFVIMDAGHTPGMTKGGSSRGRL